MEGESRKNFQSGSCVSPTRHRLCKTPLHSAAAKKYSAKPRCTVQQAKNTLQNPGACCSSQKILNKTLLHGAAAKKHSAKPRCREHD